MTVPTSGAAAQETERASEPATGGSAAGVRDAADAEAIPRSPARACWAIFALLALYACTLAEAVLVPILIAALLGLIFAPLVRALERWRIPRAVGALVAIATTIAFGAAVFLALAAPARAWIARMPRAIAHLQSALHDLRRPLQAATDAGRELGKLTSIAGAQPVQVVESSNGILAKVATFAPTLVAGLLIVLFLTFLFLLHGDDLLRKLVSLAPHLRAKRDVVQATRQAQHELSLYMITITAINAGLGLATTLALYLLRVPDPLLWGGLAALLNYAPFVGPLAMACVLTVVGFAESASPLQALAAPAAFLTLHLFEGQLVTPHLVGRRLALDPVMVFLALVVLGWGWGVAGLLLAVPLMSCAKILAERSGNGRVVATLLSR